MDFLKKQSGGFFTASISAVLAVFGLIFYLVNCGTAYFSSWGVNALIVVGGLLSIAALATWVVLASNKSIWFADALPILSAVFLTLAFALFVNDRAGSVASIMTFENNEQNMADLSSALIGMVLYFLSLIMSIVASFGEIRPKQA